jgi:hypothetical protein
MIKLLHGLSTTSRMCIEGMEEKFPYIRSRIDNRIPASTKVPAEVFWSAKEKFSLRN